MRRLAVLLAVPMVLACGENGTPSGGSVALPDQGAANADAGMTTACPGPVIAPVSGRSCRVREGSGQGLLLRGTLLLPDGVLGNGGLLIQGEKIVCAGCDCSEGAQVVECPDSTISPGLINPHDHLGWTRSFPVQATARYDHRHEWRKAKNGKPKVPAWNVDFSDEAMAWGELRHLLAGTTSMMGEGSVTGLLRNLDWDNEGLGVPSVKNTTFPLGDNDGEMLSSGCGYPAMPDAGKVKGAVAWVPHVAEGVGSEARNELLCLSGQQGGVDLVQANTSLIHAVGIRMSDATRLAQVGARVIWSPRSNISLYGHTADVVMLRNLGVTLALGTDWTVTGSINLLRELACADHLNQNHYGGSFTDEDLWRMVTEGAALSAGLNDRIGLLCAGHFADVAVFAGASGHRAVIHASVQDVALVIRGGKVLLGEAPLVSALGDTGCEPLTVCGSAKKVCLQRETGYTVAGLTAKLSGGETYPLFFCGTPDREPTCVPSRQGRYDGTVTTSDRDGDGIPNTSDNCPTVFNPLRPLDGPTQPDTDGDGVGDACDS